MHRKIRKTVMFQKFIGIALLSFVFPNLATSQGLLDKLKLDEGNTSLQLYELIKPILLYDPKVVKIAVLKDIKVFKGLYHGFKEPNNNDDRQIYKWLNAKSGEILLKVNVQVNLDQNYVSEIKSKLAELADLSEPMDGSSCKRCRYPDPNTVKFYVGSIKGNDRTQVYLTKKDGKENMLESHYALGMRNQSVGLGRKGLWVNKPFTYYGFDKSKENGKLCINLIKNVIADIQPPSVVDHFTKKLKPAHDAYWSIVYPHIVIKFVDGGGKIVNKDELFYDTGLFRTASTVGYGTARAGENDTYQSIVSIDRNNGWHDQDYATTGLGPKYQYVRFSALTNTVKFAVQSTGKQNCRFGIAEQTNFSIITKVNKKILGSTQKIIVDMHYQTFDHVSTKPSFLRSGGRGLPNLPNETHDHVSTQPSMVKKRTADNVSAKELLAVFQCTHKNQVYTVEFSKENKDSAVIQRQSSGNNTQVNKLVFFGMNPQEVLYKKRYKNSVATYRIGRMSGVVTRDMKTIPVICKEK